MKTVSTLDLGGEVWKNDYTGITVTGRVFVIEDLDPQKETAIYVIPNNVVDIFIRDGQVRMDNSDKLAIYNKCNYVKINNISDLGGYTVPIVFTDVVQPISMADNYVSSEVKKFLHGLGMREVAPNIKGYLMQFIAELNKGNITDNKLDRVNKFLGYFGAKVRRIEIGAMNESEKLMHSKTYTQPLSTMPPAVAPATTGMILR